MYDLEGSNDSRNPIVGTSQGARWRAARRLILAMDQQRLLQQCGRDTDEDHKYIFAQLNGYRFWDHPGIMTELGANEWTWEGNEEDNVAENEE